MHLASLLKEKNSPSVLLANLSYSSQINTEGLQIFLDKIGKKVELKNKLDERLIGGVKVVVHDHVFDGSVKYKLETLKEQLKDQFFPPELKLG